MSERYASHDTFVIEKNYDATPAQVFAAWADPAFKAKWFAGADEFDFRVGGVESNVGGPPGGPVYTFKAQYEEIVQDERIVYSYTMDLEKTRISVSVSTVEFKPVGAGTQLIYTEQGVFLDGHDSATAREHGTAIMLDNLGKELRKVEEADREIVNTRIFDMPRKKLFQAFNNSDHLAKWWGPKGFTNTFHEFDQCPDGVWRYTMHGPDGVDYENKSVFVDVVEPERIVLRHLEPNHEFLLSVTLEELDGKTQLNWRMLFDSVKECEKIREFCYKANEENLDRLEAQLERMVGQT
ncbi:SRPBCC family protein [Bacillus sp. Marseille-Q3570]|uniref:SRPBCC family protein n=1 Tax=Bacillus sp. Marseille-Q3570 TaxID=2963522 RepID=UPI0028DB826A|nr:SRPBCC family protein [Bacillus sp. Marseille-Q3570]